MNQAKGGYRVNQAKGGYRVNQAKGGYRVNLAKGGYSMKNCNNKNNPQIRGETLHNGIVIKLVKE